MQESAVHQCALAGCVPVAGDRGWYLGSEDGAVQGAGVSPVQQAELERPQ